MGKLTWAEFINQAIELAAQLLILGLKFLLIAFQLPNLPAKFNDSRSLGAANLPMLIQQAFEHKQLPLKLF